LEKTSFLTPNEKREAAGYGSVQGGDQLKFSPPIRLKYSPDQPRDDQGQWTSGDGGEFPPAEPSEWPTWNNPGLVSVSDPVDLLEEEGLGGHTYARHVGKSDLYLINRVKSEVYWVGGYEVSLRRAGTFPSVEAANKLTNATLSDPVNRALVESVARGNIGWEAAVSTFSTRTGVEAYASSPRSTPYMRDTYSVTVRIVHDASRARGYRVLTSYPMNEN